MGREGHRGWVSAPVKPQQAQPRGREQPMSRPILLRGMDNSQGESAVWGRPPT